MGLFGPANRRIFLSKSHPDFKIACCGEIANPLDSLVSCFLVDLQEPDVKTGAREHGDLELEADWRLLQNLLVGSGSHEVDLSGQGKLSSSGELGDRPDDTSVLGPIPCFSGSLRNADVCGRGVFGHGYLHDDALSEDGIWE